MSQPTGALAGLRVIDISRVLAGPFCAMMLGDHGADVIKVEAPGGGDETRLYGPPFVGSESAYYLGLNRNKRGIILDLSRAEGREVLLHLIDGADVVVENFKLGTMERWGLSYEEVLRPRNPRLVYCSVSGFGRTGPYAHLPGYDALAQALSGFMSINGFPDREPVKAQVPIADLSTGIFSFAGILLALQQRSVSGQGQRVDTSLLESVTALLHPAAANYLASGKPPGRMGNDHPNIWPYGAFRCLDGSIFLAVSNNGQFARLCQALGAPQLLDDPRFADNPSRVRNREAVRQAVEAVLVTESAGHWQEQFWAAGVPASPINSIEQVFALPQIAARQMLRSVEHPAIGGYRTTGIPVKLSDSPGEIRRHPPLYGQHTRSVLAESGLSDAEIAALLAAGVAEQGQEN